MVSKPATKAVVLCISLLIVLVLAACAGGGVGGEVKIPIHLENASNVGSLHIEMVYCPTVLQATEVKAGDLGKNAMIESNLKTPGRVIVGIIDASGINGDGQVVEVSFNIVGEGTCTMALENVEAYDASTLYDIAIETSPGNVEGNSVTAPLVLFRD